MTNKEKYEGKTVRIYAPFGGRLLDILYVKTVEGKDMDILYGKSKSSNIETAYYLSDGIKVEVID